jgi:hypothetical protein
MNVALCHSIRLGSTGVFSPGARRPGREVNHLPPAGAEVKNA